MVSLHVAAHQKLLELAMCTQGGQEILSNLAKRKSEAWCRHALPLLRGAHKAACFAAVDPGTCPSELGPAATALAVGIDASPCQGQRHRCDVMRQAVDNRLSLGLLPPRWPSALTQVPKTRGSSPPLALGAMLHTRLHGGMHRSARRSGTRPWAFGTAQLSYPRHVALGQVL
eukprot:CAMPEP_0196798670 /NCGR_PEP_ID=MMETSP1104-20130614/39257_1 /TAXON_ID=33652 /ORGANISM="Cafeteria sp., Strain Caron Lab Isolate" /LENGTH=171 /DNA_ID=CAMNT_0042169079 /DNA_START=140 /DNA_END=656 /DNA_ORIENTATION=+